jgi:hypothetical protein
MTTRLETRWEALELDPAKAVFQLVDAAHPLSFYIGRQVTGERLFLLIDTEMPPELRSFRALGISSFQRADGRWGILLCLMDQELAGTFALLCQDLVESSRRLPAGMSGFEFVARRLGKWRLLLEQRRSELLSLSEIRGLFAELFVLQHWLASGACYDTAVAAWVGPLGADQDFQTADAAWEVKSVHPDAESVTIASEMQLYSGTRRILLLVLGLSESNGPSGLSLNQLVGEIRDRVAPVLEARRLLDERLDAAGYLVREEYDAPVLAVIQRQAFAVVDGFPRIIRPALPAGIQNVRYTLSLAACGAYAHEWPLAGD